MESIDERILQWARLRSLLDGPNPVAQAAVTCEEAVETLTAVVKEDFDGIVDGIGDTYVTLVILARMYGKTVEECAEVAYREIKNRTGTKVNGRFVKDSDIPVSPEEDEEMVKVSGVPYKVEKEAFRR